MNLWLLKSEPGTYSFSDLVREGSARWDGVSAPAALTHLRAMRPGDQALIYHTGDERAIVGIAKVTSDPYPDPKLLDPKRVVIDLAPVRALSQSIPLASVKADKRFADFGLVRISRLSVMPVTRAQWDALLKLKS